MTDKMPYYIGVKQVQARPMTLGEYNAHRGWTILPDENPASPGYLVCYPDGYQSWSPAKVFEAAYIHQGDDPTRITPEMVDQTIGQEVEASQGKTAILHTRLRTGFEIVESSSCVDPANYDHDLGVNICRGRTKDQIWKLLGFVLQWARN